MATHSPSTSRELRTTYFKSKKARSTRLQRLLKAELVKGEWGISSTNRRVRIYKLTAAGAKHLEREVSSFERMLKGITRVLALRGLMNWLKQLFSRQRLYDDSIKRFPCTWN